jgi:hypothetical protein
MKKEFDAFSNRQTSDVNTNAVTAVGIKVEAHGRDRDGAGGGDR